MIVTPHSCFSLLCMVELYHGLRFYNYENSGLCRSVTKNNNSLNTTFAKSIKSELFSLLCVVELYRRLGFFSLYIYHLKTLDLCRSVTKNNNSLNTTFAKSIKSELFSLLCVVELYRRLGFFSLYIYHLKTLIYAGVSLKIIIV